MTNRELKARKPVIFWADSSIKTNLGVESKVAVLSLHLRPLSSLLRDKWRRLLLASELHQSAMTFVNFFLSQRRQSIDRLLAIATMSDPPRIAFKLGGSKRPVVSRIAPSNTTFDTSASANQDQVELVTSLANGEIQSTTPVASKQELVIPSQPNAHQKFFKSKFNPPKATPSSTTITDEAVNQLDDDAKRALILDAQKANEAWDERSEYGKARVHTIAQLASNTFSRTLENGEGSSETNAEAKDEEEPPVDNADYDAVPIEDFGMAVLRGMGYKEDSGLGITNKKQVDVFVAETRPRGLGLGADRKVLEKINQLKRNLKKAGINESDDLCMEKGACVLIEKGPHADMYGTIESIDEDVSRLTVALAIGGTNRKKEVISISQYYVKLVTETHFLKYSKYVNKSKAEKVEQETSEQLMQNYGRRTDDPPRSSSSAKDDDDDDRRHRHRSSDRHRRRDDESKKSRRH